MYIALLRRCVVGPLFWVAKARRRWRSIEMMCHCEGGAWQQCLWCWLTVCAIDPDARRGWWQQILTWCCNDVSWCIVSGPMAMPKFTTDVHYVTEAWDCWCVPDMRFWRYCPLSPVDQRPASHVHQHMFLAPQMALGGWAVCVLSVWFSVCVVMSMSISCAFASSSLGLVLFAMVHRCFSSVSFFSLRIHSFGLVWLCTLLVRAFACVLWCCLCAS